MKKNFRITESAAREAEKKNEEHELPQYEQEQAFLTHKVRFKGVAVLIFTVSHRRWFNEQDFLDLGLVQTSIFTCTEPNCNLGRLE